MKPTMTPSLPSQATTRLAMSTAILLLMSACATKAPPQHLMALPTPTLPASNVAVASMASKGGATTPASSVRWLQIGRVDLPEYWQARALRYRDAQGQIATWDGVVWAERIEIGVTRNLTVELAQRLPKPWQLCTQVCGDADNRPVRLLVTLSAMDFQLEGQQLTAWAQSTLLSSTGLLISHQTQPLKTASTLSDAPAALVQSTADMVGLLADAIAKQVQVQAP